MRIEKEIIKRSKYTSETHPQITSTNDRDAEVIRFLDENPVVYEIVTKNKSKAFGMKSCDYIGWAQRNNSIPAILEKIRHFKSRIDSSQGIFDWRARFTLEHYRDKGFTGGFFKQWDAKYPRDCMSIDYTPETLEEVVKMFAAWISPFYDTQRITVDDKEIRRELWAGGIGIK
jgi:hypothetical protein